MNLAYTLLILGFLASCSFRDESLVNSFMDRELTGEIAGEDWSYEYAFIDPTVDTPNEDDFVFVFLPYRPKDECPNQDEYGEDNRTVMVSGPKLKKTTKLKIGTPRTLVMNYEKRGEAVSRVAKRGKLKITSITDQKVRGKVVGRYNGANWVNGSFSATVCGFADFR